MRDSGPSIYRYAPLWAGVATVLLYAPLRMIQAPAAPGKALLPGLVLLLGAVLASLILRAAATPRDSRVVPAFVMAALALLPAPGGFLVFLVSATFSSRGGPVGFAAAGLAVLGADLLLGPLRPDAGWFGPESLFWFVALYASLQLIAAGTQRLMRAATPGIPGPSMRQAGLEAVNIPLAWILCGLSKQGELLALTGVAVLAIVGQIVSVRLGSAARRATRADQELGHRIVELDTLHAISREIISSLDPSRVCSIVERGCRKIFPFDLLVIAMLDPADATATKAYVHRRGAPAERVSVPGDDPLTRWIKEHKRGMYVEDTRAEGAPRIRTSPLVDAETRSMLVAPLVVEDRTIGLLSIQRTMPRAYDGHSLNVLTTMAQQAAVALESARHYEMATVDSMTRFFLRDYFFRRLEEEYNRVARYGGTFSLLMVDLDGFKQVNDQYGHLSGDRYLRAVSGTIQGELRAADLPCRYGGDEFCLLLPETDLAGASAIAERIRDAVAHTIVACGKATIRATASIGVASFPDHDSGGVRALMQNADEALYRAKRAGRDCVMPFAA